MPVVRRAGGTRCRHGAFDGAHKEAARGGIIGPKPTGIGGSSSSSTVDAIRIIRIRIMRIRIVRIRIVRSIRIRTNPRFRVHAVHRKGVGGVGRFRHPQRQYGGGYHESHDVRDE